jgi:vacuolar iron transporter family protein
MDLKQKERIIKNAQKNEITEHVIYRKLAQRTRDNHNKNVLLRIADDEKRHYDLWKGYTKRDEKPDLFKVWLYIIISRILGLTFGIKLMEHGEGEAQETYRSVSDSFPEAMDIAHEEDEHEEQLIRMIDEERLIYVGSMIRGLNDALVELTGALAGFTLALQDTRLIAMTGLITGIAASLSMGATEYLASKSEESRKKPLTAALYTGTAYILTVLFLIFPYLLFDNIYIPLGIMILNAIILISLFNFYMAVALDTSFWKRFSEMAILSMGVAAVSFLIGFMVRRFLGVDV